MPAAGASAQDVIAVIQQMKGDVEVARDGERQSVTSGYGLEVSDVIHTGPDSAAGLQFTDGALVALGSETEYALESYEFDAAADRGSFDSSISRGTLSIRSGRIAKKGVDRMRVRTPATILGVRGTRFMVRVDPEDQ
ncbi:MAG: FecR domain-containing protein [Minwuia sp.]|uniref:FecR family protein n=1 Tax=Minwuia sp. TaxID=2493630 RepID=UPI003A8A2870